MRQNIESLHDVGLDNASLNNDIHLDACDFNNDSESHHEAESDGENNVQPAANALLQPGVGIFDDVFESETIEFDHGQRFDSDDDEFSEDDADHVLGIEESLSAWAIEFQGQVSHAALAGLLTALKPNFPHLPRDPRTLLHTNTSYNIVDICGGQYYHFGIKSCIVSKLEMYHNDVANLQEISLQVNIDGLPLFKSSCGQIWPILCFIEGLSQRDPFAVGIFYGTKKPTDASEYLSFFSEEVLSLYETGITYAHMKYPVKISAVVCDAPARAFVKNVKGHTGYYGCERCTQQGVWDSKMTFPLVDAPARTNEIFSQLGYENHQLGTPGLADLPINMIVQFPLDYMHLVCLGVVRRLILLWKKGPAQCRISAQMVTEISNALVALRSSIPSEFARKPRSLLEVDRWKATEFRQFLLYTGPLVLSKRLPDAMYKNFLLLSVAMHILLSQDLCKTLIAFSKHLLVNFVQHFSDLYGKKNVVYNVHSLIHLPEDAQHYGFLDSISAFPFENYLGKLKKLVRKPSQPLQQIVRRISEKELVSNVPKVRAAIHLNGKHSNGPVPNELAGGTQYKQIQLPVGFVSCMPGDNCVEVQDKICVVKNIMVCRGQEFIVFERFRKTEDFFSYPVASRDIGLSLVSRKHYLLQFAPVSDVSKKIVLLPLIPPTNLVIYRMIHHHKRLF
ncbi:hypothetical protein HOLleu_21001 [Holothuria leucospilota]|uniref:Transposase domain-containing protein n=1 Tax=Holothuria leucospilota TaxID=206669 RepID=A0A9Q1H5Q1_HOLLE|nr:hypothetical protein HOLleu_21001 [Holothuria leucospilota]